MTLLLEVGLRASEAASLRWSDIDEAAAMIAVRRGKRDRDRIIPVPPQVIRSLRRDSGPGSGPVLHRVRDPSAAVGRRTVHRRIAALGLRAQAPCHPHTLRHNYACSCLRAGLTISEVATLLGHSDLRTTTIYLHVAPDELADRVRRLLAPQQQQIFAL